MSLKCHNPFALKRAITQWSYGCSECDRVKVTKKKKDEFADSIVRDETSHLDLNCVPSCL